MAKLWRLESDARLTIQWQGKSKWCAYSDDGRYCGSEDGLAELDVVDGDETHPATEPDHELLSDWL